MSELALALVSDGIADYLATLGIGTVGTNIFVNNLPAVDNCVAIFDTGGEQSDIRQGIDYPTIQVRVKNTNTATAYKKLMTIYDKLHMLHNITLGNGIHIIDCIGRQSAPMVISTDYGSDFTMNYTLTVSNDTVWRNQ
jgi:minor capsid protein